MRNLKTELGESIYLANRKTLQEFLRTIDADAISPRLELLESLRKITEETRLENKDAPDTLFDDLYVVDCYVDFLDRYAALWKQIVEMQFSASWRSLQESLDILRTMRRFSEVNISYFEDQLIELEKTYPYNFFFSIGVTVEKFECSICGEDMESPSCSHRKGHLYRGKMAQAIARNIVELDHIAMVDQPEDKRCVVSYEDDGPQFKIIRYVSTLVGARRMLVSQFGRLVFSKRRLLNPDYQKLARNELCYCGSGRKFKRCCLDKNYIESDHVDIVARSPSADLVIL